MPRYKLEVRMRWTDKIHSTVYYWVYADLIDEAKEILLSEMEEEGMSTENFVKITSVECED